ncbi:MAG: hypothetical protein OIF57_16645 [Marinobacterium sp.]|nr:hypothetical protein [Marinobacterium sp.]
MDIGQPRPTSPAIQQNAGNNPVLTQEADQRHHEKTTLLRVHDAEEVRISPDARDYLKRERDLSESQLHATTRQFSSLEANLQDRRVMAHLQRLSSSESLNVRDIHGIGLFEMEGMEPIAIVIGELSPAQQQQMEQRVIQDESAMQALRKLPSTSLSRDAVEEILPALGASSGDLKAMTQVLMRLMLSTMLDSLQSQLKRLDPPLNLHEIPEIPIVNNPTAPDQRQLLKAGIIAIETHLASQEHRIPRNNVLE